jgi:thioredoxin 1
MFKPAFNETVEKFDDIDVQQINVDDNQELSKDHAVRSIPTVIMIKDSKEVFRNVGVMPKSQLESLIKTHK